MSSQIHDVSQWLGLSLHDYLAARLLLRERFLLQGAQLGATAIEKALKAVLRVNGGVPHGHITAPKFLEAVATAQPNLWQRVDRAFLNALVRAYRLRYVDDAEPGSGVVLHQGAALAALDRTMDAIDKGFIHKSYVTPLRACHDSRDPRLWTDNVHLDPGSQKSGLSYVEQHMVDDSRNVVSLNYLTRCPSHDVDFARPAARHSDGAWRPVMAYNPAPPGAE